MYSDDRPVKLAVRRVLMDCSYMLGNFVPNQICDVSPKCTKVFTVHSISLSACLDVYAPPEVEGTDPRLTDSVTWNMHRGSGLVCDVDFYPDKGRKGKHGRDK